MDEALEARKAASGEEAGDARLESDLLSPEIKQMAEDLHEKRPEGGASGEDEGGADEFDYLAYARERAMFFWGDVLQMGLVEKEELPEELRERAKIVEY